jgi:hypothetical protein
MWTGNPFVVDSGGMQRRSPFIDLTVVGKGEGIVG